jgi:AcrR family transcriptional regulator
MSSETRPYVMRVRADRRQDTRRRIAAAAASLHEEVGPARTTIAEVARRAGVQRPTVYNHFPTERELYAACQGHFLAEHPPPDLGGGSLELTLERLYAWYRETEAMTGNVQRDRRLLPALDALLAETADAQFDALADGRPLVRLALDFATWQRLASHGLSDAEAARLMADACAR